MRPNPPSRRSSAAVLLAGLLLGGACVQPGDPDVGIRPLSADIVFGAPKKDDATPRSILPDTGPAVAPAQEFNDTGLIPRAVARPRQDDFPEEVEVQDLPKPRAPGGPSRSSGPAPVECRAATVNDFAPEVSPGKPGDSRPTAGVYRWKRSGIRSFTTPGVPGVQTQAVQGFEERVVRNVRALSGSTTDFEYETVQKDLSNNVVTTTWRVRQNAENRNVNSNFPPVRQNAGEPDRGLSLVSFRIDDATGKNIDSFTPRTPLLYLPIETRIADSFTSIAVDPRNLRSIELEAAVAKHTEVDACGQVVDGWLVESTLTENTSGGETESKFNYVVANQFGSMVISTHTESPVESPTTVLDFSIARITPTPLPAG